MNDQNQNIETENLSEETAQDATELTAAEAESAEVGELLETRFQGSLPAFISAFSRLDRVSDADMDEMLRMIRQYREENHHDEPTD